MPAEWLNRSSELSGRVSAAAEPLLRILSRPENLVRLRRLLILLLSAWALLALARLLWALFPAAAPPAAPPPAVINPVSAGSAVTGAPAVDIERMRGWHLFGKAGAGAAVAAVPEAAPASVRDGIEKGARDTRLALKLRGAVASTDDGLGHAIIENKSRQAVYAVGDKLPVPGRVTLAKVMRGQVILDNGGTYERLVLFDETDLDAALSAPLPPAASELEQVDKRGEAEVTALAAGFRDRLYSDPQSLTEVLTVSAVREGGSLLGYRVAPGSNPEQFAAFGFQPGDVVTSINGISLDSPSNTMRLYNAMRSAGEVVFELRRDEQPMTIAVSLDGGG